MKKTRGTLQQKAYQQIKEYILNSDFYPGQHIRHVEVSRALGMSRTPAREAMQRLVEEGLVVYVPNRGYFVNEMTAREAEELYELREILEVFCVQQAIDKSTNKQLGGLRRQLNVYKNSMKKSITRHTLLVDRDFHLRIAQLAGNEMVYKLLVSVLEKVIMKRNIERIVPADGKTGYKRHAIVLKAIESRDKHQAVQQIREHIRRGKIRVLEQVKRKHGSWLGKIAGGVRGFQV
jgi:DNA-binding GntR family transcriptional regulator